RLPTIPAFQTIVRRVPNASVACRQGGSVNGFQGIDVRRERGDRHVPKAVKALFRGYPDVAFAVLEQEVDRGAGEPVVSRKRIDPPMVQMEEALLQRTDP